MTSAPQTTESLTGTETEGISTQEEQVRLWRSFMQLGQMARAVLECEPAAQEGVTADGLAIMRLLRWSGPQSRGGIAAFLADSPEGAGATHERLTREGAFDRMVGRGLVREVPRTNGAEASLLELTREGTAVAQRVVDRQRAMLWAAAQRVDPSHRPLISDMLEQLILGLTGASATFDIVCAECWAFDHAECFQTVPEHHCPFRRAGRAGPDPPPECRDGT